MSEKGGARNYKKQNVEREHLLDRLKKYVVSSSEPFNLSDYEGLWASCRPRTVALASMCDLGHVLVDCSPECAIRYSDLKPCLEDVLHLHPSLRGLARASEKAGFLADKLMVVQKHYRQLALEPQLLEGLPQYQKQRLEAVIRKIDVSSGKVQQGLVGVERAGSRQLSPQISNASAVTTDSQGWPIVPGSEESVLMEAERASAALLPCTKKDIKELRGVVKKPASLLKKPAAGGSAECKTGTKSQKTADFKIVWKDLVLKGPCSQQSYIVQKMSGKQVLVVACNSKQSPEFHAVLEKVLAQLKKKAGATKSTAVECRDAVLKG